MKRLIAISIFALTAFAGSVSADFVRIENERAFRQAVEGKTLARPLVRLQVGTDGSIIGKGAKWKVSGNWTWRDGFFCRSLVWGGTDLGHNCQEVRIKGSKIRFTSDLGRGAYADFRINGD